MSTLIACPKCSQRSVSRPAKFHSTRAKSASCRHCGALLAEPGWLSIALPLTWVAALVAAANASIHLIHWWPFLLALAIVLILEAAAFLCTPLCVVSPDQAQSSQRRVVVFSVVVVFAFAVFAILAGLPQGAP